MIKGNGRGGSRPYLFDAEAPHNLRSCTRGHDGAIGIEDGTGFQVGLDLGTCAPGVTQLFFCRQRQLVAVMRRVRVASVPISHQHLRLFTVCVQPRRSLNAIDSTG